MPTDIKLQANISPSVPARPAPTANAAGAGSVVGSGSPDSTAATGNKKPVSQQELTAAVGQIANYVQNVQRNLNFSVDEASGETVIKVIDSESSEVIRQIPSEEMLALARRLRELNGEQVKGLLMQSKA